MHRRKRIDPRVIGGFVVGAIILSVAGLLFFGPGGFLAETRNYVIHFNSSVKGLNVGSPVRFRGVKIGQVKEINVRVHPQDFKFYIPVIIAVEPSRFEANGSNKGILDIIKTTVQGSDQMLSLVNEGLRAQLQLDSLVTGQLYVNFDMFPDTPIILTGYTDNYPELPSVSSSLEELTKTFEGLPLTELADKLIRSVEGFEKIINSPSLHNALAKFDNTTTQLDMLLQNLNEQLLPLADMSKETLQQTQTTVSNIDRKVDSLMKNIEQTFQHTQATIIHIDNKIDPLSEQLSRALQSFNEASIKAADAVQQIKKLSSDDSQILGQLTLTLQEINRMARTVRYLMTELERDPQMLLRGRSNEGTK
jgi:paraquat-inducible protein B